MKRFSTIVSTVAVLLAVALIPMQTARADITLTEDDNLNSGAPLGPSDINPTSGDGTRAAPYLYTLADNLNLGTFKLYSTLDSENQKGTSFKLDLGGNNVTGVSGTLSLDTSRVGSGDNDGSGSVTLVNVGEVSLGGVDLHTDISQGKPGDFQIGESGTPATGDIRVDYIHAQAVKASQGGGGAFLYGSGDVTIATSGNTVGDILAWGIRGTSNGVTIVHDGNLLVGDILTYRVNQSSQGSTAENGPVTLDGGSATGSAVIGDIDTSVKNEYGGNTFWQGGAGNVSISNYASLTVGAIDTSQHLEDTSGNNRLSHGAGDVNISGIAGDVDITGPIDTRAFDPNDSTAKSGEVNISAGGAINLGELDMSKVGSASLDGVLSSMIDKLLNFDTSAGSGSGSTSDPFITTQTALRTPTGEIIYYNAAENTYLGGATYQLADLDGDAGQGGWLTPAPVPEPTTLALLSLGGLLGLTGMARRRRRQ